MMQTYGSRVGSSGHEPGGPSVAAWFGFWVPLAVLVIVAIAGLVFASADAEPGDYACGLLLFAGATLLAFLRIKQRFDGGPLGWGRFLLVEDVPNLTAMLIAFGLLALAGLIVAAAVDVGGLHIAGVALFVTSGIGAFLSLKHVFDNLDRGTRS